MMQSPFTTPQFCPDHPAKEMQTEQIACYPSGIVIYWVKCPVCPWGRGKQVKVD